jgi:hypothetical protein
MVNTRQGLGRLYGKPMKKERSMKLWQVPLRVVAGTFILDQGLSKRDAGEEQASNLQGFASTAVPQAKDIDPRAFVKILSGSEMALGAALLAPFVPSWVGGLGLMAFSSGLLRLYLKTPGLREDGGLRPSQQGIGLAKDSWLFAIGLALVLGARDND